MKSKVNNLKNRAKELGYDIKHGHALEILAAINGHKDYNSYKAFLNQNDNDFKKSSSTLETTPISAIPPSSVPTAIVVTTMLFRLI